MFNYYSKKKQNKRRHKLHKTQADRGELTPKARLEGGGSWTSQSEGCFCSGTRFGRRVVVALVDGGSVGTEV